MTIHDEVLWSLTQPDDKGKVPLFEMIESYEANYILEYSQIHIDRHRNIEIKMTPDVFLSKRPPNDEHWIIEVENDLQWDFSDSLRQIKKYMEYMNLKNSKYKVIIPKIYDRFTPMYQHENIDVWTWEAERIWQCIKCDALVFEKRSFTPNCVQCKDKNVRLFGVRDFVLHEEQEPRKIIRRSDSFINGIDIRHLS